MADPSPDPLGSKVGGFDRHVFDATPMALLALSKTGEIIAVNLAARALLGERLEGRVYGIALRQPDILVAIEAALARQQTSVLRAKALGAVHDQVHKVTVQPLAFGALLAFEDLTVGTNLDRMRSDFVANVSHELRTPLTGMIGIIETLGGAARDDAAARDVFLPIMAAEAERMKRLLDDLLALSLLEAQEDTPPQGKTDLAALARQVAARLTPLATAQSVTVKVVEDTPLPALQADPDQMTQVLTNLIENALKYGSPTGACVTITLGLQDGPRGPQVRLCVQDQGEGIDPLHLPRLTERFYRVDGHRSRVVGGTGLGLSIVKHIVGRHRGRLVIESTPGFGSQFSVFLPLAQT